MSVGTKIWLTVMAVLVLGILIVLYRLIHPSGGNGLSEKQYKDSISIMQKRFDSLQLIVDKNVAAASRLQQSLDSAAVRDSVAKTIIAADNIKINKIKKKYENNTPVDDYSGDQLLRFLSDAVETK